MQPEKLDVVIIGAGVSGINAAVRLKQLCPNKTFTILESKDCSGGTWDTFRYPGVRSDIDMWTYSFTFKPWTKGKRFGSGRMILNYLREIIQDFNISSHIRYQHKIISANWDSKKNSWMLSIESPIGTQLIETKFLWLCAGYFDHNEGYTPDFKNLNDYQGTFVHSQKWSNSVQYTNKKIIVIGSGATAIGMIPPLSLRANHITMLQRSPNYVLPIQDINPTIFKLQKFLPKYLIYLIYRWNWILKYDYFSIASKKSFSDHESLIKSWTKQELPTDNNNFIPNYQFGKQRVCVTPNGEFFQAIKQGKITVINDTINYFTKNGIMLNSGKEITADIIVSATGLKTKLFGGVEFYIDDNPIDFSQHFSYRGSMISNIPNLAYTQGYFSNSWMVRSDMVSKFICKKIIRKLKNYVIPELTDTNIIKLHHLEEYNNSSGYWERTRKENKFYMFSNKQPWRDTQHFIKDLFLFKIWHYFDRTLKFK